MMVKYLLDQKCAIIFCVYFRENLPECQHHNTRFSRITKHCMSFAWNTIISVNVIIFTFITADYRMAKKK